MNTRPRIAAVCKATTPEPEADFADALLAGLRSEPKHIPCKYFYDAEGSRLFEQICALPEYYPTRVELALLRAHAAEMAALMGPEAEIIEFGAGAAEKIRPLLRAAHNPRAYLPIDISGPYLQSIAERLRSDFPALSIRPIVADFTRELAIPASGGTRVGFFPGSTIGNFTPEEARNFLVSARHLLGEGASFLVGIDLVKDERTLVAAYDDALGVTAAFNKNLLGRINRELGGDFHLESFVHRAVWNAAESRIEMHLESLRDQQVTVAGRTFSFRAGETLHTENSCKFTVEGFSALAEKAGWTLDRAWSSEQPAFAVVLLRT